jgi:GNAT superfamily N-acetyltransferase
MEWVRSDGFFTSDDREQVDIVKVHHWLSDESYWAAGRSIQLVQASIYGSITLSCFDSGRVQVGITRLITDGAAIGVLSDVFVDEKFRGLGLGQFLAGTAMSVPEAQNLNRVLLATRDAHELYRRFGFSPLSTPEKWMEKTSIPTDSSTAS